MALRRFFVFWAASLALVSGLSSVQANDGGRTLADALPPWVPPPADLGARRNWLRQRLDELFAPPALAKTKIAMAVMDPENGGLLYARNEKIQLNVASNVKLVTLAAALAHLGPEFRWKTTVQVLIPPDGGKPIAAGGELRGDLVLRPTGDPALETEDLATLAGQLAMQGLRKVRGALVVDTGAFDSTVLPPAFEQKNDSAAFRAPSSAASLDGNVVTLTLIPAARVGARARVVVTPPSPAIVLKGSVLTALREPALPHAETSDGGEGKTRVTLSGRIALGAEPRTLQRRIATPETFLGMTFLAQLQKRGIVIDKPVRAEVVGKEGYRTLASVDSPPLAIVAHDLGKRSSNFAAEQLLRTLGGEVQGRPGTFGKGLDVVARYLESIGIPKNSYQMKNGSGLYDSNRFSAEQMCLVLRAASRDFRMASEFLSSLAVGGADGTLAHRMANSPAERFVRAKTGTLANVSSLSGMVGAPGIKPLVFSIVMNDIPSSQIARALQDRATALLVYFLDPSLAKASL